MIRYITSALAAIVVALGALSWLQYQRIDQLQAATTQLTAERDAARLAHQLAETVITHRDAELRLLQRQQAQRQKDLDRVLQDNRDWADQPVPPGVADWLRQRAPAEAPAAAPGASAGLPAP